MREMDARGWIKVAMSLLFQHRDTEAQRIIIRSKLCYSVSLCLFREIIRMRLRVKPAMRDRVCNERSSECRVKVAMIS